ncbi:MAG: ABC transporter substrate-binding protein [Parvularculaceae bacterium]|nr:ABC transporter substrate-binding protein [Parvularculaceae bacterium]
MIASAIILASAGLRVFSADFCADQLTLALAEPAQIAALSPDADKDFSFHRTRAEGLPRARADAEAVMAAKADVVLRFWGGDAARLDRLGITVVTLDYASDFDGVKRNVRTAAAAIGRDVAGEALIAGLEQRLGALAAMGKAGVTALYVTPGGVTAGKETMIDSILAAAGVENRTAAAGLSYWPPLSAEAIVADPPAFVVAGFFASNAERINHWSAARHPALIRILKDTPGVAPPADVLSCPGPQSVDAAEMIRKAADARQGGQR